MAGMEPMAAYSLSLKAAADLDGIYEYTLLNFGQTQARKYLMGLHECFERLADNPYYGRSVVELASNLRRLEYQSHVVFYRPREQGVLIVRVLHESMNTATHFQEKI